MTGQTDFEGVEGGSRQGTKHPFLKAEHLGVVLDRNINGQGSFQEGDFALKLLDQKHR